MKQLLARLGVQRSLMLILGILFALLLLMLLVGWAWTVRLPPAPTVLPDPQILVPATISTAGAEFDPSQLRLIPRVASETEGSLGVSAQLDGAVNPVSEDYSLASRPLFWASRRPQAESDTSSALDDEPRPTRDDFDKVKLVGVYYAGDNSGVIAEIKGKRQRVRLKQALEGWVLDSLGAEGAVFIQGGKQRKLQLEHANSAQYTATASKKAGSNESATQNDASAGR